MQQLIVTILVIAATLLSTWKLMPARRRLRVLLAVDAWAARHDSLAGLRGRLLKPRIARARGAGCAGCAANVGAKSHHPR
jgi:hypothetical protein